MSEDKKRVNENDQPTTVGAAPQAFHRSGNTGVVLWDPDHGVTFLATGKETNGAYAQNEGVVPPGGGVPPHIHHREDETVYVLEGSLEVHLGDETFEARTGDYVNMPRGIVHYFRNVGKHPARSLATFVPAGIENFFAEVYQAADRTASPPPSDVDLVERMRKAAPKYGLEILPLPESGA
jgi:quercetin dioxygenase-like cupin family protein